MKRLALLSVLGLSMSISTLAFAADSTYNTVPAGDAQYAQCLSQSLNNYTGGRDPSPIAGQTKVQAFCTCMWNETPDNFKGNLASFAETAKGATTNKTCESYSSWGN